MKKYGVFMIAIMTSFSLSLAADAKPKKSTGIVKAFGTVVNDSVKSGTNKNVKGGFYGKSTMDQAEEKPAAKAAAAKTEPVETSNVNATGEPVNVSLVRKNQSKEEFLASGILYLSSSEYNKALDSFKKAQAISDDIIVQRWVDVANNKIKIKSINAMIEASDIKPQ